MLSSVRVFFEGVDKQGLGSRKISHLIRNVIEAENRLVGLINVIFCDDEYLVDINQRFLKHNTLTDVITFDYCADFGNISGDIFISYDRVKDNAFMFQVKTQFEAYRVAIHGVLHLLGYDDRYKDEILVMRQKEDFYLALFCSDV